MILFWHKFLVFFNMGGFGDYIWSAYGISVVVLLWLLISTLIANRKVKRQLRLLDQQQQDLTGYASST